MFCQPSPPGLPVGSRLSRHVARRGVSGACHAKVGNRGPTVIVQQYVGSLWTRGFNGSISN